jgi:hypothetical protein
MFNEICYHDEFDIYYPIAHKVCFTAGGGGISGGGIGSGGWGIGGFAGDGLSPSGSGGGGGFLDNYWVQNAEGWYPASAIGGIQNATGWSQGGLVGSTPASGWMTPAQAAAYSGPNNTGAGSRGVTSFGRAPSPMSWSSPSSPGNAGYSGGWNNGGYKAPSYARFASTPFSAPPAFNNPVVSDRTTMQSNPLTQALLGQIGGKISGPANPYNNGQFVRQAQPSSVFDVLQGAWDSVFNTMGVRGAAVGFGSVPGGKTGNMNAPGQHSSPLAFQQSDPGSFQQHTGVINYGTNAKGESVVTNNIAPQGFLSADAGRGQSPGMQLAAAIGNLTPGQALSPGVLSALQSSTPNVITLAMDHAPEITVLALMQESINKNTPLTITPFRYQRMTPAMVTQILDNPQLSVVFRTPYVDATKGIFDKVGAFLQEMGLGFRFNTAKTVNLNFRVNPSETQGMKATLVNQLVMLGYSNATTMNEAGEPVSYGQATTAANSILGALQEGAQGSTIIGQGETATLNNGISIRSEGNNQYSVSMPGPLYGSLGYSAQSYMQMMATGKSLMGESGNPWSGNSHNLQMLESAKRTGGQLEIGPVVKADGTFDLGVRPQTVPGFTQSYYTQSQNDVTGVKRKTLPISGDTLSDYTQVITAASWPDVVKQYFIQSSVYAKIVKLWQSQSPDTPFPDWANGFDWQGYYSANTSTTTPSTGGGNMYRPRAKSGGQRRLRSVSY